MHPEEALPRVSRATEILADWLAEREHPDSDDLDGLCAEHRDHEGELRSLYAGWQTVRRNLPDVDSRAALAMSFLFSGEHGQSTEVTLDPDSIDDGSVSTRELIERLVEHRSGGQRYTIRELLARGGMGEIHRIWDLDLRRHLAMKILREDGDVPAHSIDRVRRLGRFLEEAQIQSQLEHPAIVPVHDIGLDDTGRVYFTMPLIRGNNLENAFAQHAAGSSEWTLTRSLHAIVKVCEALAYAHAHDVVHRDIKPANVMIGRFGETFIMDWGLARVLDRRDAHDTRLQATTVIETERSDDRSMAPDSPLMTMDGHVVGTPSYMAPEQAMGLVDEVGPWSDIYAVGAMLYHLLAGSAPYLHECKVASPRTVLKLVQNGPPPQLAELVPTVPRALEAICEKAMARRAHDRYASALDMARDIEAFLEDRPTRAERPGRLQVLRLAFRRNRALVATVLTAAAVVFSVLVAFVVNLQIEAAQRTRMLDFMTAQALTDQAEDVYPIHPDSVPKMQRWIARADELLSRADAYATEREPDSPPTGEERGQMLSNLEAVREILPRIRDDLDSARALPQRSVDGVRGRWDRARDDIASLAVYGELGGIDPQVGLVPLRRDPDSGLWEFWVVLSGDEPHLRPDRSSYDITDDTGIVLVLLPGGEVTVGSPADEEHRQPNEDRRTYTLRPFFLSKYETTQGQWQRVFGDNPSSWYAGRTIGDYAFALGHPVERVTWHESTTFARRMGLLLPTEVQWEYACRAGEQAAFHWGSKVASLRGRDNVNDPSIDEFGLHHAPVSTFPPNAFGLCEMHGNVSEWCRDPYRAVYIADPVQPGDGLQSDADDRLRVFRGGSYAIAARHCRSAFRNWARPSGANPALGVRVARALDVSR